MRRHPTNRPSVVWLRLVVQCWERRAGNKRINSLVMFYDFHPPTSAGVYSVDGTSVDPVTRAAAFGFHLPWLH